VATLDGVVPDAVGGFMDFDGSPQGAPDLLTRGMWAGASAALPDARYYVNVYPALTVDPGGDADGDRVCDDVDNCPNDPNPDQALKGVFTPARSGGYRFTFLARRLALGGPFGPPAGVTVSDARSIDRAGSIAACTTTAAGMTCRQP